jgi:N4-gp56 family major capsid protein
MANAYTDTSGSSLGTSLVQAAYDRLVEKPLRAQPLFRTFATKRPERQAMPGSSVIFQLYNDIAENITELVETTDPDSVIIGNTSSVTVTLREQGAAALATRKLQLTALADVDPAIADIIAENMIKSLDTIAQNVLKAGSNVIRENAGAMVIGGTTVAVQGTDTIKSRDFRAAVAKLRGGSAMPTDGSLYTAVVHPDVSMDLRAETGAGGWRTPSEYGVSQDRIWTGTVGVYEGALFHENPRCYKTTDGASSETVFRSYVLGKQAMAEAVAVEPHVVIGPVTDKLMRFRPIGWYGLLGMSLYRTAALYRIESAGSLT